MVGMTGSGKTTLAARLLDWFKYTVVFDPKGLIDWNGYRVVYTIDDLFRARENRLIYKPSIEELSKNHIVEQFFEWIYERRNTTLYVDEVFAVAPSWSEVPFYYKACLTRGRERGITTLSSTQRPTGIPSEILSESEYGYWFKCRYPSDAEKIEKVTGIDRLKIQALKKQQFFFTDLDNTFGPLKLNL